MGKKYQGVLTEKEEFLYPDSVSETLPESIRVVMPKNGKQGIQLLLDTTGDEIQMDFEGDGFYAEWYEMIAVPVEYNTGDGENQGGAMVLVEEQKETPAYATRKAPFFVYDCLKEQQTGKIPARKSENDRRAAVYFCICPEKELEAGEYSVMVTAKMAEGIYQLRVTVQIYDVRIPENTFWVTNWFSEEAICRFHGVEKGSEEYLQMLRKYIQTMRRMHQNVFFIQLDEKCVTARKPYQFDFEYLTPEIEAFFEAGMQYMELGVLLDRGKKSDGMPDMYTEHFTCAMAKDVPFETLEGYELTVTFVKSLANYLTKHGWEKRVLFHIHDEPDIHYQTQEVLEARKRQYYLAAGILRKYIPGIRIIEAVDSAEFRGGIDIWVPGTAGYEKKKEEFDTLIRLGETVWTYVCCGPEGHWLNRFLDFALLKGRMLFWGCAKNRISGFLHWGLNQFPGEMNPYEGTSCPNHTGIGTNFPCGDSFLIYPGEEGPRMGMRLEAQRRGAEDAALWQMLRKVDETAHDRLLGSVFTNNYTYKDSPELFAKVYEELLSALQNAKQKNTDERSKG